MAKCLHYALTRKAAPIPHLTLDSYVSLMSLTSAKNKPHNKYVHQLQISFN